MWRYVQRTGEMFSDDGERLAIGYAGLGEWKNQPEADHLRNRGPLPKGEYLITARRMATTTRGPYVLVLTPDAANEMHGRSAFLIHGDSTRTPGTASNGCIILGRLARETMWNSGDREVRVVAEHEELKDV